MQIKNNFIYSLSRDSSEDEMSNKFKRRSIKKQEQSSSIVSSRTTQSNYESDRDSVGFRYELKRKPKYTNLLTGDTRERAGEELADLDSSDNYTNSDESTDYSDSYQHSKDYSIKEQPLRTHFEDVEQQRIPDYVSMEIFHENYYEEEAEDSLRRVDEEIFLLKRRNSERATHSFDGYLSDDEMDTNETTVLFKRKYY